MRVLLVLFSLGIVGLGIVIFYLTPHVGLARNSNIFKQHPINSEFGLSNGDTIQMPWHIYSSSHLVLLGESQNPDQALEILRPLGLYPVLSSRGWPLVGIGFIEYADGAAGAYDEFYIAFFGTKSPSKKMNLWNYLGMVLSSNPKTKFLAEWMGSPDVYYFIWKMHVTTTKSLLGGREIWGYPKDLADIQFQFKSKSRSIEQATMSINGTQVVSATCKSSPMLPYLPVELALNTATPQVFKHTMGNSYGYMKTAIWPFNSNVDSFEFVSPGSAESRTWAELEFLPWLWIDSPVHEVVLSKPYFEE